MCWHRHNWRIKEQRFQPSLLERMIATNMTSVKGKDEALVAHVIVTYCCSVCGAEKVQLLRV